MTQFYATAKVYYTDCESGEARIAEPGAVYPNQTGDGGLTDADFAFFEAHDAVRLPTEDERTLASFAQGQLVAKVDEPAKGSGKSEPKAQVTADPTIG